MKLNMDMRSFFKLIGRKSKHFFSLLFVWAFFQINIQAQTEVELINIDFSGWKNGSIANDQKTNGVYFHGEFSISDGVLVAKSNMGSNSYAVLPFVKPSGIDVIYLEFEVVAGGDKVYYDIQSISSDLENPSYSYKGGRTLCEDDDDDSIIRVKVATLQAESDYWLAFSKGESKSRIKKVRVYYVQMCQSADLSWSNSIYTVEYGTPNPSYPTLVNPKNLTPIQYSSSNQGVATIDANSRKLIIRGTGTTTITATFVGDETYCSESVSYSLTVTCSDAIPYITPESGVIDCEGSVELKLVYKDAEGAISDLNTGSVQWYQQDADGTWVAIPDATPYTYTATSAGIYKALVTNNCPQWTGNEAVVTLSQNDPPVVEKLTPFQYYQLDSTYAVAGRKIRHLFKVTPKGKSGEPYQVSATVHRGSTISSLAYTDWITSKNNTDTIIANYDGLTDWSKKKPMLFKWVILL